MNPIYDQSGFIHVCELSVMCFVIDLALAALILCKSFQKVRTVSCVCPCAVQRSVPGL